jgi:hypothetical protein
MQQKPGFIDENHITVASPRQPFNAGPVTLDPTPDGGLVALPGPRLRLLRGKNPTLP